MKHLFQKNSLLIIVSIFILSCNLNDKIKPRKEKTNKSIDSVNFNNTIVSYKLQDRKGNYISIKVPDYRIWKRIILCDSQDKTLSNNFFLERHPIWKDEDIISNIGPQYCFDSLKANKEYKIKYVSSLLDTLEQVIKYKKNMEVLFQKEIENFYPKTEREVLINKLKLRVEKTDTIQFLSQSFGCFGFNEHLYEYYNPSIDSFSVRIKNTHGSREDDWDYLKERVSTKDIIDGIDFSIKYFKKRDSINYKSTSTSFDIYRMKFDKEIYIK